MTTTMTLMKLNSRLLLACSLAAVSDAIVISISYLGQRPQVSGHSHLARNLPLPPLPPLLSNRIAAPE